MARFAILGSMLACVSAFHAPSMMKSVFNGQRVMMTKTSSVSGTMRMAVEDLLGADVETQGVWDPFGFSNDESSLYRNRCVEIKHGRVAMLAVVGIIVQTFFRLPDPVFNNPRPLAALQQIYEQRPEALAQIVAFAGLLELVIWKQDPEKEPGDVAGPGWVRYKDSEVRNDKLLKELKNGRLAMLAVIGMWVQETLTGQGPVEQILVGHISPFGDGQGFF